MENSNKKIGFIGSGNMGEAFVGSLIQAGIFSPSMIYVTDISEDRLALMRETYGIHTMTDNAELFSTCDIVVFAIKPQQMDALLSEIAGRADYGVPERKLLISIAAGIPIRKFEDTLYAPLDEAVRKRLPIVRVMPNTPALVLEGMSGMSANPSATSEDITLCKTILGAVGQVIEFKEDDLDAVTGVSGSGPAYVFYLAESMIEAGINVGLAPDDAKALTLTTIKGALKLMEERDESPEELRRKVTSPGGTTEAALKVLEGNSVRGHIVDAIAAATHRSKELSKS